MTATKEEINGCLGVGEQNTDYLIDGLEDNLPTLYEQDLVRYEYNQNKQDWSKKSCTIFASVGAVSDLFNYEFTLDEIKEINDLSYERGRVADSGWYVQSAVKLVADWWNEHKSDLGKVAYYQVEIDNDETMSKILTKNYDIVSGYYGNYSRIKDKEEDGILNLTGLEGSITYGHCVCMIEKDGKRYIKDNYAGTDRNYYEVEHKWSEVRPFHSYGYVYTKVAEDSIEEVKRLNEIKALCNSLITDLGTLRHKVNDENFRSVLHYMANKLRSKVNDADCQLKKY